MKLYNGDCSEVMKKLPDNSVDSIVTDPPYGLKFMGKKWDYEIPSVEIWQEAIRVLKPGGHLLSFGGSRTYHRMAVAIEDAGFEIRDQIMWVYGSGFPKSHNISIAIDKQTGGMEHRGRATAHASTHHPDGTKHDSGKAVKKHESITQEAKKYEGWGTALKPSHEPICMARKPLSEKTVALNVIKWGCGGINIDGCRVGFDKEKENFGKEVRDYGDKAGGQWQQGKQERSVPPSQGRFPANFIHDGSDEVVGLLGEPARFFYFPKASKKDRNEGLLEGETSTHPCVKPTSLMQYLVRLVTPKGGICLDPFMGSGSTGKACALEGFDFIGIELDPEYFKIAEARIENI